MIGSIGSHSYLFTALLLSPVFVRDLLRKAAGGFVRIFD